MNSSLAEAWGDLLTRRPSFLEALEPFTRIVEAWDAWPAGQVAPLPYTPDSARRRWLENKPLLADDIPSLPKDAVEPLLHPALEVIAVSEDVRPFVDAWDRGDIAPSDLLPAHGRIGAADLPERSGLTPSAVALLGIAGLRPALVARLAEGRRLVTDGLCGHGRCPCCGGPPGFADLLEDGRRQLACHQCDTRWTHARLACPFCGTHTASDLTRLIAGGVDEGYAIAACRACRGYVKELDRRVRWNAGPALVEDWGTPHLDLVAQREGYRRPLPSVV